LSQGTACHACAWQGEACAGDIRVDNILRQKLDNLPPLDGRAGQELTICCKLCGGNAELFDVVDFQKHCSFGDQYSFGLADITIPYHRCVRCGFLFTDFFDDWSSAEFAQYVYNQDYVVVDPDYLGARPRQFVDVLSNMLIGLEGLRILDYGAGSGLFVAGMRAAGFTATAGFDPFSNPERPDGLFDIVTCFETLEHTIWPDRAITDMHALLRPEGLLIFSQCVQPDDIKQIRGAWWYVAPRNGHISMFTVEALQGLLPSPRHSLHSDGLLWVMVPPSFPPALSACVSRMGPALMAVSLRPPPTGDEDSWHAAEPSAGGPFRWSRNDTLRWLIAPPARLPAKLQLRIPFAMEIEAGFASGCTVLIAGLSAVVEVADGEIRAQAWIEADVPELVVTLRTPAPRSPFDLRGVSDARRLGVAMRLA
jgi:2-polyprenyl-6-hydroxyphenyl methylase/3-demethylubiquinone-9 3-methyltransferase